MSLLQYEVEIGKGRERGRYLNRFESFLGWNRTRYRRCDVLAAMKPHDFTST